MYKYEEIILERVSFTHHGCIFSHSILIPIFFFTWLMDFSPLGGGKQLSLNEYQRQILMIVNLYKILCKWRQVFSHCISNVVSVMSYVTHINAS